jgi:hypothetical protein
MAVLERVAQEAAEAERRAALQRSAKAAEVQCLAALEQAVQAAVETERLAALEQAVQAAAEVERLAALERVDQAARIGERLVELEREANKARVAALERLRETKGMASLERAAQAPVEAGRPAALEQAAQAAASSEGLTLLSSTPPSLELAPTRNSLSRTKSSVAHSTGGQDKPLPKGMPELGEAKLQDFVIKLRSQSPTETLHSALKYSAHGECCPSAAHEVNAKRHVRT